jgi:hypothetical protein
MKRLLRVDWWRARLTELAVAIVLAIGIIYFSTLAVQSYRATVPPNAWIAISEVFVPDHTVGEDPLIIYDRTVRQDFTGAWVVEVQKEEPGALFSPICVGMGVTNYSTDVILPDRRVALSWYIGKDCKLQPGRYRLRSTWTIQMPDWPEKKSTNTSNIFTVYDGTLPTDPTN